MIGKQEIADTIEFLENVVRASDAEWGDKMATWRKRQYDVVDEDLAFVIKRYVQMMVAEEVVEQIKMSLLGGRGHESWEDAVLDMLIAMLRRASVQWLTIGMELHRRYCVEVQRVE